ncbi:MAG TPA: cysteine-rich CWC family protein [Cyclobacteriaceae bacterium]
MYNHPEYMHEPKACPRCQTVFECKVGSVENCQCQAVRLSDDVQKKIQGLYEDCLCANCLRELTQEHYK